MDELEARLLRELDLAHGYVRADELALRVGVSHWVELSTAVGQLLRKGYVTAVGPIGRAETRYRIHPQGRAALHG